MSGAPDIPPSIRIRIAIVAIRSEGIAYSVSASAMAT